MNISENFRQAIEDYVFLLNKKYPEKSIHELVSTRYSLSHSERSMLYRGISTKEKAEKRKSRQITIEQLNNRTMHVDLFNVLYTLAAYLRGFPVFISNDGMLRDASESHGTGDWEVHLDQGLDLFMNNLENFKIGKAVIYIDNPLNYGLVIWEKMQEISKNVKPPVKIISDPSPDHLIREAEDGVIVTSDTTIIDKSPLPVFDLPAFIIRELFHKEIPTLINKN